MLALFNGKEILDNIQMSNGWHFSKEFTQWEFWHKGFRWAWLAQYGEILKDNYWICVCDSLQYKLPNNLGHKPFAEAKEYVETFVHNHGPYVDIM